jgi:hypothetical protein
VGRSLENHPITTFLYFVIHFVMTP